MRFFPDSAATNRTCVVGSTDVTGGLDASPLSQSADSVLGIATMLQTGRLGVQNSEGPRHFSLGSSLLFNGQWGSFPGGVKRSEYDVDRSPQSSVEVKSEWHYKCLHDVDRGKPLPFTFLLKRAGTYLCCLTLKPQAENKWWQLPVCLRHWSSTPSLSCTTSADQVPYNDTGALSYLHIK